MIVSLVAGPENEKLQQFMEGRTRPRIFPTRIPVASPAIIKTYPSN